jgi:hypothetical protein
MEVGGNPHPTEIAGITFGSGSSTASVSTFCRLMFRKAFDPVPFAYSSRWFLHSPRYFERQT